MATKAVLKSNMDRFIAVPKSEILRYTLFLKSNMDRFIAQTFFGYC